MRRLLASYPPSWILAMGTSADAGQAELLFDLLENDGAARITLGPLDLAAQVALVGDVLGAIPDQGLIELAADAAGNPLILAEAFRGLRDENAIVVRGGHASLVPAQVSGAHVTRRIEALARHRLKGLSVRARRFVETASILGSSSRLKDVGEMLAESPGAMLAALDEALSAYLLMVRADGLAFRHEFIRQAFARMLAEPIQQALHRQFGQMLLARGGSAVPAAYHLIRGARPGDAQALAAGRLDDADALAQSALRSMQASAPGAGDSLAVPVLATVALRRGDLAAAAEYGQRLSAIGPYYGSRIWPTGSAWWRPRSWRPGAGRGRRWTSWRRRWLACPSTGRCCWPIRPARHGWSGPPWPPETARWPPGLSQPSTTRHETNPTLAVIRASAEHAEGLLAGDVSRLQHAADQLADPWARACAVEDQGVLLAAAGRDDEAIRCLQEALVEYGRLGARAKRGAYPPAVAPARGATPALGE